MTGIAIIAPLAVAAVATNSGAGPELMLTSSPREAWRSGAGSSHIIDVDLGELTEIDAIYLGAVLGAAADASIELRYGLVPGGSTTTIYAGDLYLPDGGARQGTSCLTFEPVIARRLLITINQSAPTSISVGNLVCGRSWSHPYAWGAGRQPIDLSRRTELSDGGFGIDPGIVKAAFKWRFAGLNDESVQQLWSLTIERGSSKPIVVIEDVEAAPFPAPSVHYGLFDRLEAYERANPQDTQWAMSLLEWR